MNNIYKIDIPLQQNVFTNTVMKIKVIANISNVPARVLFLKLS